MSKSTLLSNLLKDKKKVLAVSLALLFLAVVFLLRFAFLDNRPVHHDEGVNGWFVDRMWENHFYNYDPQNYHGPLYFYFLQVSESLFGRNIIALRLVPALFSCLSILLLAAHKRFFGKAALWAACAFALSPAMVFYARYSIHETVFIFFQILFSYGFFLAVLGGKHRRGAILMLAGFFGSYAIKETFFIFYAVWIIACVLIGIYEKLFHKQTLKIAAPFTQKESIRIPTILFYSLIAFVATAMVYTDFFRYLPDLRDMFMFFEPWTRTGLGNFHAKPFLYYVSLILRYEWVTMGAGVLGCVLFFFGKAKMRFWVFLGFGMLIAYSLISYKTPWLILNILWPFAFVFGFGIEFILEKFNQKKRILRISVIIFACALLGVSGFLAIRISFFKNADPKEAYVYTHTDRFISEIIEIIDETQKENPLLFDMPLVVRMRETWPLPWLLEKRGTVAWGGDIGNAAVIFADESDVADIKLHLKEPFYMFTGKLRDSYSPIAVFLKESVFPLREGAMLYDPGVAP